MALTLTLVVAAVLIVGGVDRAVDGLVGFDKRQLLTAELTLPERPYADLARRRQFVADVLDRLKAAPGATHVAAMSTLAYASNPSRRTFLREGAVETSAERPPADLVRASADYLETMRIPLLAGRALGDGDGAEAPRVALVSQVLADRYFPGDDPLGRRFKLAEDGESITVVGIVGDVVYDWFANRRNPTVYVPLAQDPTLRLAFAARTAGTPEGMIPSLRQAVAAADPDQPLLTLRNMERVVTERVAGVDYFAKVLTVMSGLALLLALTGMYSLMAYLSARNTKEVGLRHASRPPATVRHCPVAANANSPAIRGGHASAATTCHVRPPSHVGRIRKWPSIGSESASPRPVLSKNAMQS